ncbi:putative ribonuclease H-like domain-containing protein [Tanacetum coccineum]
MKNEMKARGTLLMALPNKDQLKFHSYKDAKLLMEAIEKRYGGNKESKKVQRTLLKQQYENFAGLSSKIMDQTFDRLQKLISQLEIQGEVIEQEDMNLKLLRSLLSEWKTHALIWRNKVEIETISLDDLYNNLKIYEPELTGSSSTSQNPQNVAFVSSNSTNSTNNTSSTNKADNTAYGVSTANTKVNIVNSTCVDNLSDVVICAFLASQPNSPQLAQEDLEQIHHDDLEEMDLQWEIVMLTIRARRFIKRRGRNLDINGQRIGFDRLKVDSCSKSCVKAYASLKEQYDSLSSDYKKSQFNLVSYKAGLQSVEARLAHYKKNEAVLEEKINVLNLEVNLKDNALVENKKKLEKAEKERDELKLTLEKFQNSSKSLNNLLESQVIDKFKTGLGYNAVSLAVERTFMPPKLDLMFIDEQVKSKSLDVVSNAIPSDVKTVESKHESIEKNSFGPPIIEDWNSDDESEIEPNDMVKPSNPQQKEYKEKGVIDSGCSRHMTGNKCYLTEYEDYGGGFVSFGDGKGRISGKGKIKTGSLDFDDVYFCKELKYNLFNVSLFCDKKNNVLFTDTECLILSSDFKLLDKSRVLLRNGVAERKNRTLIEAVRTMDHLVKFDGKADEGFFVGYSVVSKAMRVFNKRTRIVEETLNIRFLKNTPNMKGNRPYRLFNVNSLTMSMNYVSVVAGHQTNDIAGNRDNIVVGQAEKEKEPEQEYILIPLCTTDLLISQDPKDSDVYAGKKAIEVDESEASDKGGNDEQATRSEFERPIPKEMQTEQINSTNNINIVSTPVSTTRPSFADDAPSSSVNTAGIHDSTANAFKGHLFERFSPFKNASSLPHVPNVTLMHDTGIFGNAYDDEDMKDEVDTNNVVSSYTVPDGHSTKFLKDHPQDQEAMQDKLLQFKLLKVWTLVDLLRDKWAIGTKWVFKNKKDERGIVVKNKDRLVAQGHTQEEGIDYDEVFAPVARIEAIRLFLAYASFKDFVVYQMDIKSAFLYGKIEEEVYVYQPPGFEDPDFPDKVYKVEKALYGLHHAPRAWYETLSTYLLENGFHRGQIDKTLFIKRHKDDILLVQVYVDDIIFGSTKKELSTEFEKLMHDNQDKYVAEILKKFNFVNVKTTSTTMEPNNALIKDEEAEDVDVHLYKSMIGSLMYLTASRLDITFAICACARFQVTPKTSHLHVVKRIFGYLKGQPKLSLWYPRDSPFDLEAFFDSDYAGASLDMKSTTGAEYVAAVNCYGQVLWIQNQMLDYQFNFMNTKIYIDNESTICIVKNLVFHSKTKHIEIRHHFIRDSYEKKLIQVIKIYTDQNVADLLIKAFDVNRFNFLNASIGMLNL